MHRKCKEFQVSAPQRVRRRQERIISSPDIKRLPCHACTCITVPLLNIYAAFLGDFVGLISMRGEKDSVFTEDAVCQEASVMTFTLSIHFINKVEL